MLSIKFWLHIMKKNSSFEKTLHPRYTRQKTQMATPWKLNLVYPHTNCNFTGNARKSSHGTVASIGWTRTLVFHPLRATHKKKGDGHGEAAVGPPPMAKPPNNWQLGHKVKEERSKRNFRITKGVVMILAQVHLRKPCYDFTFLYMERFRQVLTTNPQ